MFFFSDGFCNRCLFDVQKDASRRPFYYKVLVCLIFKVQKRLCCFDYAAKVKAFFCPHNSNFYVIQHIFTTCFLAIYVLLCCLICSLSVIYGLILLPLSR